MAHVTQKIEKSYVFKRQEPGALLRSGGEHSPPATFPGESGGASLKTCHGRNAENHLRTHGVTGMNFNQGPFGGHHLGADLCPPTTFHGVPH